MNELKLNLGCGTVKKEGYINCDIFEELKPDKIVDCNKKLPFKSNSVDEIYCMHVLEHLQDANAFLSECWRICKPNAKLIIGTPHNSNTISGGLLFHTRAGLNAFSFKDYEPGTIRDYYTKKMGVKFHVEKVSYDWFELPGKRFVDWFCGRHKFFAEHFLAQVLNLNCIEFEIRVIKDVPSVVVDVVCSKRVLKERQKEVQRNGK